MNDGVELEKIVFDTVSQLLQSSTLPFTPKYCKVLRHQAYYSFDRKANIVADVSVEVYLPKFRKPSIIWIWECKDHKRQIAVGDVQKFHVDLQQIAANRTVGTIICRSGYQQSAINFARSTGIGLARLLPDSQIEWVLRFTGLSLIQRGNLPENFIFYMMEPDCWSMNSRTFFALGRLGSIWPDESFSAFVLEELRWIYAEADVTLKLKRKGAMRRLKTYLYYWLSTRPFIGALFWTGRIDRNTKR